MNKEYNIIGLMSGTSLDGLDIVYCRIWKHFNQWKYKIEASKSIAYDDKMENQLKNAIHLSSEDLLSLHNAYGTWLGEQVHSFITNHNLTIDYVASHGHTVHHQPHKGYTLQIGSGQHLANACHQIVICDFRTNDVALGGQGAPLVPIGDKLLFSEYDFCLNLGGISNISFDKQGKRIAYDIGLANMLLNYITRKEHIKYDNGGQLAAKGSTNHALLTKLNELEYYTLPYPKSIGYEWFLEKVVPLVEQTQDSLVNLLHTAVQHICQQISIQIKQHIEKTPSTLLVTGGGAYNHFLIAVLQENLKDKVKVIVPDTTLIESKEALIFALMGVLRVEQELNVLSSVTGATKDSSSGIVYLPS